MKSTALSFLFVALAPLCAFAAPISYSFTAGDRAASVQFTKSGSNLIVTLTNTSTADALVPTDILTAVFFEATDNAPLTRISAMVPLSSSALMGGTGANVTPLDRVVGGEWSYLNSIVEVPPQNEGISSTGLGVFGPGDRFPGDNLQGPDSPDGVQYGITAAGDNLLTGNGGITGQHLIKNSVVFTLGGFTGEPDAKVVSATFLYGTAFGEQPLFNGEPTTGGDVPEPTSFALAGAALLGLWAFLPRLARRKPAAC